MSTVNKPSILVVDDDQAIAELVKKFTEINDLRATVAHNGRQALDLLKQNTYDLILTDLDMPVMDGYELLERIKTEFRQYKVMVISTDSIDRKKFLLRGAVEAFHKPFSLKDLVKRIRELLQERRRAPRFTATEPNTVLKCRVEDKSGTAQMGKVANISADGALIQFGDHPQLPQNLHMIFLNAEEDPSGTTEGTLIRTLEDKERQGILAAVEFADKRDITMLEKMREQLKLVNE